MERLLQWLDVVEDLLFSLLQRAERYR